MLKELPKLLDRDFLIGFFLPAALFAAIAVWILTPIPEVRDFIKLLTNDPVTGFVIAFMGIGVLAIHLTIANRAITRFLEGYYFPLNSLWFPRRWQRCRRNFRLAKLSKIELHWDAIKVDSHRLRKARDKRNRLLRELATFFPNEDRHVLPTRFGNIIRSFEVYPGRLYGIYAIPAWPRITAVIPEEFSKQLSAAKSSVDYYMNVCLLFIILGGLKIYRIYWGYWHELDGSWIDYLFGSRSRYLAIMVLLLVAYWAYRAASNSAIGWGNAVKSAFDLYLGDLAKQLGYEPPLPSNVWREITQSFLYVGPLPAKPNGAPRPIATDDGFTC